MTMLANSLASYISQSWQKCPFKLVAGTGRGVSVAEEVQSPQKSSSPTSNLDRLSSTELELHPPAPSNTSLTFHSHTLSLLPNSCSLLPLSLSMSLSLVTLEITHCGKENFVNSRLKMLNACETMTSHRLYKNLTFLPNLAEAYKSVFFSLKPVKSTCSRFCPQMPLSWSPSSTFCSSFVVPCFVPRTGQAPG